MFIGLPLFNIQSVSHVLYTACSLVCLYSKYNQFHTYTNICKRKEKSLFCQHYLWVKQFRSCGHLTDTTGYGKSLGLVQHVIAKQCQVPACTLLSTQTKKVSKIFAMKVIVFTVNALTNHHQRYQITMWGKCEMNYAPYFLQLLNVLAPVYFTCWTVKPEARICLLEAPARGQDLSPGSTSQRPGFVSWKHQPEARVCLLEAPARGQDLSPGSTSQRPGFVSRKHHQAKAPFLFFPVNPSQGLLTLVCTSCSKITEHVHNSYVHLAIRKGLMAGGMETAR